MFIEYSSTEMEELVLSKILVVGGAGYIGSHMVKMLSQMNYEVIVLGNLSTGYKHLVKYGHLIEGDMSDSFLLKNIFLENEISAVMHFAANSLVGESMQNPAKYYQNNVANTLTLLAVMKNFNVKNFIFSLQQLRLGRLIIPPLMKLIL